MKIKVVFTKDCKRGHRGEIKEVAPALFNNVLSKQGVAVKFGSAEANNILNKIQKQEKKHEEEVKKFTEIVNELAKNGLTIEKSLTPAGHFYEKIDNKHISEYILEKFKYKIPADKIILKEKINQPGEYQFEISGHGIKKTIKLIVKGK